jgi:uncharacterized protein (UPF0264 family)
MRVLVSPISVEEAFVVCESGAHVVDVKNVKEGSLGANFPWIIREVVEIAKKYDIQCSATLGDLPNKPGTASLAAAGVSAIGVDYVKAGLYGVKDYDDSHFLMKSIVQACREIEPLISVVAAGYADFRRFNGLPAMTLVDVARDSGADFVMVDTAIKDGSTLFDHMSLLELQDFIESAKANHLKVALAGALQFDHIDSLRALRPDLIGVRGCLCRSADRTLGIDQRLVQEFVQATTDSST